MNSIPSVLDPRSVIVLAGLMGVIMSLVVFSMRRSYPPNIRGLREWAWAPLVAFLSTMMFAVREWVPGLVSIVLANMVLFQASILYYAGSQKFLTGRRDTRAWTGLNLLLGVACFWYSEVQPSYAMRLAVISGAVALLFVAHALFYVRHRAPVFGMPLMIGLLFLQAAVAAARFVTVIMGLAGDGLMEQSVVQSIYITMYSLTVLLLTIAAILMATDRVHTEFEALAKSDPLTGVLNRRTLLQACSSALAEGGGPGTRKDIAVLMIDLDHFKRVNDRFGHQMGDAVLLEAVQRMTHAIGDAGQLGRYGGEEFAVLLPAAGPAAALVIAERLRACVARPFEPDSPLAPVGGLSASIGLASHTAGTGVDALLGQADAALYRAKALGRDQVVVAAT